MISIETGENESSEIAEFQTAVRNWFAREGMSYPWRDTRDPYAVLVSELMLQQTRIATVLDRGYYDRWMRRFPTWRALSEADAEDVLKMWEGLGYYNRARNLQKAARMIIDEYEGACPSDMKGLLALPGVGRYTAGAMLSFAFEKSAPIVDGNVIRVLARVTATQDPVDSGRMQKRLWVLAGQLVPESEAREFNSGLMEIGQRVCHRKTPECGVCPIQSFCKAGGTGLVNEIPQKSKQSKITNVTEHVGLWVENGRVFLCCESGSRRKGLWRLPELDADGASDVAEIIRFTYFITRYKVELRVHRIENALQMEISSKNIEGESGWFSLDEQEVWPALASPYRKAVSKFIEISGDLAR